MQLDLMAQAADMAGASVPGAERLRERRRVPGVTACHAALRAGSATPFSLAATSFDRIDAEDREIAAFVRRTDDAARVAAAHAARRWTADTPRGPLDGVPVAVSDTIAMAGVVTGCGHPGPDPGPAAADAALVTSLIHAGAIITGKTRVDEGGVCATGGQIAITRNPAAEGASTGGAHGGAAAAVASGMVSLGLGSDCLGSLLVPAALCGVYGLRATYGAIGRTGMVLAAPSMDSVGFIAHAAEDLGAAFDAVNRFDQADLDAVAPSERRYRAEPEGKSLVFGALQLADATMESAVRLSLYRACEAMERTGAARRDVRLGTATVPEAGAAARRILQAELSVHSAPSLASDPGRYGLGFRRWVKDGALIAAPLLVEAYTVRRAVAAEMLRLLMEVDLIVMPTAPRLSLRHGAEMAPHEFDLCAIATLAGLPAVTVPVKRRGGPAAGVQLIGPAWSERWLTKIAAKLGAALNEPH